MRPDDPIRLARCLAAHWRGLEDGKSTVHLHRYVIVAACFMVACCARIEHPPTATAADAPTQPAARPLPPPPPVPEWRVSGTEPFWSVHVVGSRLVFSTPEQIEGIGMDAKHSLPGGVEHFDSRDGSQDFDLDIHRQDCSDGMSDIHYEWTARFRYGETVYEGCAKKLN